MDNLRIGLLVQGPFGQLTIYTVGRKRLIPSHPCMEQYNFKPGELVCVGEKRSDTDPSNPNVGASVYVVRPLPEDVRRLTPADFLEPPAQIDYQQVVTNAHPGSGVIQTGTQIRALYTLASSPSTWFTGVSLNSQSIHPHGRVFPVCLDGDHLLCWNTATGEKFWLEIPRQGDVLIRVARLLEQWQVMIRSRCRTGDSQRLTEEIQAHYWALQTQIAFGFLNIGQPSVAASWLISVEIGVTVCRRRKLIRNDGRGTHVRIGFAQCHIPPVFLSTAL